MRKLKFEMLEDKRLLAGDLGETVGETAATYATATFATVRDPIVLHSGDVIPAIASGGMPAYGEPSGIHNKLIISQASNKIVSGTLDVNELRIEGTLRVTGTIRANTILVDRMGTLILEDGSEIIFKDSSIDLDYDPKQITHGLLVLGRLSSQGQEYGQSFVEVENVAPNQQTLIAKTEHGWKAGDKVAISGDITETLEIQGIDGNTITLTTPVQRAYAAHEGFAVKVANLSRSITIRSENAFGARGHIIAFERADVVIHNTAIVDMGRTTMAALGPDNQTGRYAIHLHHVTGPQDAPGPQWQFNGNAILGSSKWGLAIHNSHYGEAIGNVIVDAQGAGIAFEDGSETENVVSGNWIADIKGSGESAYARAGDTPGSLVSTDLGHHGDGIWMRGLNNRITGNVISDTANAGMFAWVRYAGTRKIPTGPGEEPSIASDITAQLPLDFSGNEVHHTPIAFTLEGAGQGTNAYMRFGPLHAWQNPIGVHAAYSGSFELDGLNMSGIGKRAYGIDLNFATGLRVKNARIVNFSNGIQWRSGFTVEDSYFDNWSTNIQSSNGNADKRDTILRNVTFGERATYNIGRMFAPSFNNRGYATQSDLYVYDYNGEAGNDFQVFSTQQHASYVMPLSTSNRQNVEVGATNADLWSEYRLAANGRVAPDDAVTVPKINGLVAAIPEDIIPPIISNVVGRRLADGRIRVTWNTDKPATSIVEWAPIKLPSSAYGTFTSLDATLKTSHEVFIEAPVGQITFDPRSTDALGNTEGDRDTRNGTSRKFYTVPK